MPGRRVTQSLVAEIAHLGIERQQTGHQRAVALSGAGVHHLTRRLIDDHEVVVVENDVDRDDGSASTLPVGAGSYCATRC
jgi:hypothetical protein